MLKELLEIASKTPKGKYYHFTMRCKKCKREVEVKTNKRIVKTLGTLCPYCASCEWEDIKDVQD